MTQASVEDAVERAVTAAALDYYEGWFEGDAVRMERALHPRLAKTSLTEDRLDLETCSAAEMIGWTADGAGVRRRAPVADPEVKVRVDHVHGSIATVTATSALYVDYLQLVHLDGRWQILHALWDFA